MKIDTDEGHGYAPKIRRRSLERGVNGQTKLLSKVTGCTRALWGLFGNRRRLSSFTGSQCPNNAFSPKPIRLPKILTNSGAFGPSKIIHTHFLVLIHIGR